MTGARLTVVLDDTAALAALARVRALMADLTPVGTAIGVGLADNVRDRFEQGIDPAGNSWVFPVLAGMNCVAIGRSDTRWLTADQRRTDARGRPPLAPFARAAAVLAGDVA